MKPAPAAALAGIREKLEARKAEHEAAATSLFNQIAVLELRRKEAIELGDEIKWALEQLGDAPSAAVTAEKAPRAKRGDVQAEILRTVERQFKPSAEDIASAIGRKPSQVNKALAAMVKSGKLAVEGDGYLVSAPQAKDAAE